MKSLSALIALVLVSSLAVIAQDKAPLKTELPKALLVGTPVPIKRPNLEPEGQKGADVMAPAGSSNLAAGKKVTSSDPEPIIGDLTLVTDGDKSADDGCFVELGKGKQWVQIDLEAEHELFGVWVWHFHSQKRAYDDVVVQVSNDPDFIKDVKTLFNNDHDNSSGLGAGTDPAYVETNQGRLINALGAKARYIRLYSAGNTSNSQNHYTEVEVWGK